MENRRGKEKKEKKLETREEREKEERREERKTDRKKERRLKEREKRETEDGPHLVSADVHEPLHLAPVRGLQEHVRAEDVYLGERERVAERVVHVRLSSKSAAPCPRCKW